MGPGWTTPLAQPEQRYVGTVPLSALNSPGPVPDLPLHERFALYQQQQRQQPQQEPAAVPRQTISSEFLGQLMSAQTIAAPQRTPMARPMMTPMMLRQGLPISSIPSPSARPTGQVTYQHRVADDPPLNRLQTAMSVTAQARQSARAANYEAATGTTASQSNTAGRPSSS